LDEISADWRNKAFNVKNLTCVTEHFQHSCQKSFRKPAAKWYDISGRTDLLFGIKVLLFN